jgi:hypothetical protein
MLEDRESRIAGSPSARRMTWRYVGAQDEHQGSAGGSPARLFRLIPARLIGIGSFMAAGRRKRNTRDDFLEFFVIARRSYLNSNLSVSALDSETLE